MGDPKRPRKIYATPGHPWQSARIERENKLISEYGLRNKREVWKHYTQLKTFRQRARQISAMGKSEQAERLKSELFSKLTRIGAITKSEPSLDDVLSLEINNILERRLQTIVFRKGMAHTPKQARQFIVHGHVCLHDKRVTAPSYVVNKEEEGAITFRGTSILAKPHPAVPKVTTALDEMKRDIAIAKGEDVTAPTKPEAAKPSAESKPEKKKPEQEQSAAKPPEAKQPDAKPSEEKQAEPKQPEAKQPEPEVKENA